MKNLKFILLFIPFIASSQAREISNISPLGKLTAALDMGTDSKYYIRYLDLLSMGEQKTPPVFYINENTNTAVMASITATMPAPV